MNAVRSTCCYMLRMGLLGHATHQNQCLPVDHLQDQDLSSECGRERTGVFAHHYSGKLETCYQDRARCVCVCVCVRACTYSHTHIHTCTLVSVVKFGEEEEFVSYQRVW